jgi:very-short-patch-repair endonuclease
MKISEYKKLGKSTESKKWEDRFRAQLNMFNKTLSNNFISEYRFNPNRRYRFDFAIPDVKTAVEIDGGEHTGQGHASGKGMAHDNEKINEAITMGWKVFRFTGTQVRDGHAIDFILKYFKVLEAL